MGQLGLPSVARRAPWPEWPPLRVPLRAGGGEPASQLRATAVGAGRLYSGALLSDGTLLLWGDNSHSQCGLDALDTPIEAAPVD